jgi:8-oxo-dGTP pyrophosphatase MutT (NUDIX family)
MYKIFFGQRFINLLQEKEASKVGSSASIHLYKNKKSFDKIFSKFQKDEEIFAIDIVCPYPAKVFRHFSTNFKVIKAAGGLVENSAGKILIMKRDGMWDLPKGKIEKGEKKKQAAIREVSEECSLSGLKIVYKIEKSFHTYSIDDKQILKITYWYKMAYSGKTSGIPEAKEGITEIKWIDKNEIAAYLEVIYPNLKSILEHGISN